jgi:hypothetical protein
MLQALLKHCFRQCSSTASSSAQACRRLTVCGWCARPMASMSRSCATTAADVGGWSPTESLIAKSVAGLGPPGREDCRGVRRNDRKTLKSILVSSSRLVSLFETASYFRRSKGAIRMLFGHRRREIRLMSQVSYFVSPSHLVFIIRRH